MGTSASAEPAAAVKASPALVAHAAKRIAAAVAVQSMRRYQPSLVAKSIIDETVNRVRHGVRFTSEDAADRNTESVHLGVKPCRQGASLKLSYRF